MRVVPKMKPSEYYQMKRGKVKFTDDLIALKELDNNFISKAQHQKECEEYERITRRDVKGLQSLLKENQKLKKTIKGLCKDWNEEMDNKVKLKENLKILNKSYDKEVEDHYKVKKEIEDLKKKLIVYQKDNQKLYNLLKEKGTSLDIEKLEKNAKRLGKKADKIVAENKRCLK